MSIGLAVLTLLQATWTVGIELKKFRTGVSAISKTLEGLGNDVNGLARVLASMRDTFETITVEHGTGDLAAHWTNVAKAIDDGRLSHTDEEEMGYTKLHVHRDLVTYSQVILI